MRDSEMMLEIYKDKKIRNSDSISKAPNTNLL